MEVKTALKRAIQRAIGREDFEIINFSENIVVFSIRGPLGYTFYTTNFSVGDSGLVGLGSIETIDEPPLPTAQRTHEEAKMENWSLQEQVEQVMAGIIKETPISRNGLKRLNTALAADAKKKLGAKNIKVTDTFEDHFICYALSDDGKKIFYRIGYVVSREGVISLGTIEAATDDNPDKFRRALSPESRGMAFEFTLEEKRRQQISAGIFESKGLVPGSDLSFEDFKVKLRDVVQLKLGAKHVYIMHTYGARVIVSADNGQDHEELYELPYTASKDQIELGDPLKVVKKTTFVKAEAVKRRQAKLAGVKTDGRLELRESLLDCGGVTILTEDVLLEGKTRKPFIIVGIGAKTGVTSNGRYYSKDFWQKVIERAQPNIQASRFLGQVDHPMPEGSSGRLNDTGVVYRKVYMDGDYVKFEGEVLDDTRTGETLKALLKGGVSIGASTRVFANTRRDKVDGRDVEIVEEDGADFVGIDLVSEPAVREAGIEKFQ